MNTQTTIATFMAAAAFAGVARADFINVKFTGVGQGQNAQITIDNTTENVFSGQLKHTLSGGTGAAAAMNGDKITYCTDLFQSVTSSVKQYEVVSVNLVPDAAPMGAVKADAIFKLYNAAGGSQLSSSTSNALACAFQIAVWEVVSDYDGTANSLNVTSGRFKAKQMNGSPLDSGVMTQLNTLFASLGSSNESGGSVVAIRSSTAQDQLVAGYTIPAPGSMALLGLASLCLRRRR